jgi:hypothetical protein
MGLNYFRTDEHREYLMQDITTDPMHVLVNMYYSYKEYIETHCPILATAFEKIAESRRQNKKRYHPARDGAVNAIRIFYADGTLTPMAELAFAFGGKVTVRWNMPLEREVYAPGITAYTIIYDERPKRPDFNDWVKQKR